jgi:uncharacterized protein
MNARRRTLRPVTCRLTRVIVPALLFWLALAAVTFAQTLSFPQLTGRVVDDAGIFDPATKAALESKLAEFESKTTGQLVVVTLRSLQGTSIEDYGYQLGRRWGIGDKQKNSGALLIVAPNERKVRIEVGYGLEGQLTDAVSKLIIENAIVPRFRAGDIAGGVIRGVDDIIAALNDPDEWRARARQRPDSQPGVADIILLLLFFVVVFMIIRNVGRNGGNQDPRNMTGGRGRRGGPVIFPVPGPSWGGGGSGSSDRSGSSGGFSGGGGSFGGGGASGSW